MIGDLNDVTQAVALCVDPDFVLDASGFHVDLLDGAGVERSIDPSRFVIELADGRRFLVSVTSADPNDHGPGCDGPYNCTCDDWEWTESHEDDGIAGVDFTYDLGHPLSETLYASVFSPCRCVCHLGDDPKPMQVDHDPGDPERGPNPDVQNCCECWIDPATGDKVDAEGGWRWQVGEAGPGGRVLASGDGCDDLNDAQAEAICSLVYEHEARF